MINDTCMAIISSTSPGKHAVVLHKFTKLGEQYTISNAIKYIEGVDELITQGKTLKKYGSSHNWII